MASVTRTEKRKRGIVGWFFLILFWGFNALMAASVFAGLSGNADSMAAMTSEAEKASAAAGTAIGAGLLIII